MTLSLCSTSEVFSDGGTVGSAGGSSKPHGTNRELRVTSCGCGR
jgi:hypothetical protein